MPGSPAKRARREADQFRGVVTHTEEIDYAHIEGAPKKGGRRGASKEYMDAIRAKRNEMAKTDPSKLGGRPRTRFSKAEITEHALERLEPQALKVLERQLKSKDERVAAAAAVKILEWKRGKPGQTIKVDSEAIHTIKYETIAFTRGSIPHKADFELLPGDMSEDEEEAELVEEEPDPYEVAKSYRG